MAEEESGEEMVNKTFKTSPKNQVKFLDYITNVALKTSQH